MVSFPNAKINLGLYITAKRPDGFHDIVSCFYPIQWKDALEIIPSDQFSFTSSGIPIPGDDRSNLVVKAYHLLKEEFSLPPVEIHLLKALPMGAGLGGGSSDAAFTLLLLNKKFKLNLSTELLLQYSSQLGSDCSFFIHNTPCIASGRGELLEPFDISLKGYHLLLIHPGIHVSTQMAYEGVTPKAMTSDIKNLLKQPLSSWKEHLINQFEEHIFLQLPEISALKKQLYTIGAEYAAMSGSGSAVYGIFKNKPTPYEWPKHYTSKLIEL